MDSIEVTELYIIYTSEYEKYNQEVIDNSIILLIERGLIERKTDNIILLQENIMIEE